MGIFDSHGRPLRYGGDTDRYFFQLGERPLKPDQYLNNNLDFYSQGKMRHHCLKYGDYIFEYDDKGFRKSPYYLTSDDYSWNYSIKGYSNITPDKLTSCIENSGRFTASKYWCSNSSGKKKNNCQDFVYFCLCELDGRLADRYREKMFQE